GASVSSPPTIPPTTPPSMPPSTPPGTPAVSTAPAGSGRIWLGDSIGAANAPGVGAATGRSALAVRPAGGGGGGGGGGAAGSAAANAIIVGTSGRVPVAYINGSTSTPPMMTM